MGGNRGYVLPPIRVRKFKIIQEHRKVRLKFWLVWQKIVVSKLETLYIFLAWTSSVLQLLILSKQVPYLFCQQRFPIGNYINDPIPKITLGQMQSSLVWSPMSQNNAFLLLQYCFCHDGNFNWWDKNTEYWERIWGKSLPIQSNYLYCSISAIAFEVRDTKTTYQYIYVKLLN